MKDRDQRTPSPGTAGRSADADALQPRPRVGSAGDVGGMPSTVDAGVRDKLADRSDATMNRPVGRDRVRQHGEPDPQPREATDAGSPGSPRAAAADEEGPLESLGKAISEPVTGSPRSTPDSPKRR